MSPARTCPGIGSAGRPGRRGRAHRVLPADAHGNPSRAAGHRPGARAESRRATCRIRALRAAQCRAAAGARCRRHVLGGEFEQDLVDIAKSVADGDVSTAAAGDHASSGDPRTAGTRPAGVPRPRPRLDCRRSRRYATLQMADERRTVGYTEASRGCKHRCRHCPIVPVYDGRFRIVAADVVLGDVRAQVAAGAQHITFGDPDFFNGIRHAEAIVAGMSREFPGITYDVTIKIEHLLKHADHLPLLRDSGCAFVTSAVESVDDDVLARLEKGHTRADFERVVELFRDARLALAPTFLPFTPWTTLGSIPGTAAHHRRARPGRERLARPARRPPAHSAGVADARTARRPRGHRAVRCRRH